MRLLNRLAFFFAAMCITLELTAEAQILWRCHTIDDSFRGADGVKLADFNGDGFIDIVTGWEESGVIRLYLNPGAQAVKANWPAVTVGRGASPEDALPFDVDDDGRLDIVSCHEGRHQRVLVHFCTGEDLLDAASWETTDISLLDAKRWMFAEGMLLASGQRAIAFGSKNDGASISLLVAPNQPTRDLSKWSVRRLRDAGWIMSLRAVDMDGDGDSDLLYSDRKGVKRGVGWLEQPPGESNTVPWNDHVIGGTDVEPMFLQGDAKRVLVSTRNAVWLDFQRQADQLWKCDSHANPNGVPNGKAIARLGDREIVLTSNTFVSKDIAGRVGVWRLSLGDLWEPISATESVKLDRIECLDLDADGDLDVLTCEERKNQGVIWYENPSR